MATISKTFDPSKFSKSITKSVKNISTGFNDPDTWISTGNYAFNKKISGDFHKGIPLGKITMFAGESGCLPATSTVIMVDDKGDKLNVTIEELNEWYLNNGSAIIDTPDGPQRVSEWFNKGQLEIYEIYTAHHSTQCAFNHLIQLTDDEWKLAQDIQVGDKVITYTGIETVLKVNSMNKKEICYDFTIEHPNHRYWGDGFSSHNSGKSFLASGSIVKYAQQQDIFTVLIDTENALDEEWLQAIGVDTSPEKILRISASMVDDVAKIISEFVDGYKAEYLDVPKEDRPKVLFVVDSLGMLLTPTDINQFEAGDMKGDMGRKAKALKALVTNCTNMIGNLNIGMVFTNHTYANQDIYTDEKQIVSGGSGAIFAASIVVTLQKRKLKEDEEGNKTKEVNGIRAAIQVAKTRFAKPFEKIEIKIPYSQGLNPYSGLLELFEAEEIVVKEGNKLKYVSLDGTEYKEFRKKFGPEILDLIMYEYDEVIKQRKENKVEYEHEGETEDE